MGLPGRYFLRACRPRRGRRCPAVLRCVWSSWITPRVVCAMSRGHGAWSTVARPARRLPYESERVPMTRTFDILSTSRNGRTGGEVMALTQEQNDRLTQVGPGTPMGNLLRRYWHAIAAASEVEPESVISKRL